MHRTFAAGVCAAVLVVTAGAGSAFAATGATAAGTGNPPWVDQATKNGPLAADAKIRLTVVLNGHDDAGAEAAALAVSSPSSRSYGSFLTTAAYTRQYAATDAEVTAVTGWLTGAGFSVDSVPENHLWVRVSGTAAAAQKAFGTTLDSYTWNGRTLQAPAGSVTIPAAVKPLVAGLAGLSSSVRTNQPLSEPGDAGDLAKDRVTPSGPAPRRNIAPPVTPGAPPAPAFVNAPPCSRYWAEKIATGLPPVNGRAQPYAPCGYTPAQVRGAYGVANIGVRGAGVTVAITDAYNSPTIASDANTYARRRGDAPFAAGQFSEIKPAAYRNGYDDTENGDLCGERGWYGEETLDVEAVHGVAPAAKVLYVGAASCDDADLLDALNTVVSGHKADIVTNSWGSSGEPDPTDPTQAALGAAYKRLFIQAALTGIGMFFSSGDNGDENVHTGTRTADFPASSPWVTAVGGTSIGIGSRNDYVFEQAWGTGRSVLANGAWDPAYPGSYVYGGGGGVSRVYPQPWYQRGVVPPSVFEKFGVASGRVVPDVAALGDPGTGFLIGQTQTFPDGSAKYSEYRIGGTSLASPVMAGIEALADQASGRPHGFANPAIYELNRTRAVHDVAAAGQPLGVVRVDYVNSTDASGGLRTTFRSFQQLGSLQALPGYDDTTGVGSPNGFLWVYGLGQTSARAVPYAQSKAG
ncbi:MAG TPA: protease pro-enzyme activation domain-containing protein [Kineosporiaceae bacterium]